VPVAAPAPIAAAPVAPVSDVAVSGALAALPCVSSLAKGSYYIQIASYSDPLRAKKIVDGYAPKYPIVVEQGSTARGSVLKVCVGPVKKDEYGAILERFKSLGFKDAFVRKGE
jgi:cell division septation protein DedD